MAAGGPGSLEGGKVFEKGGVNVSAVWGELEEQFAKRLQGEGRRFFAAGLSLILHPRNPHVPTVHANWRFIQQGGKAWFGGGADLTPSLPLRGGRGALPPRAARGLRAARARELRPLQGRLRPVLLARRTATRPAAWAASSSRTPGGRWRRSSPSSRTAAGRSSPPTCPSCSGGGSCRTRPSTGAGSCSAAGRYVEFNLVYDRGTRLRAPDPRTDREHPGLHAARGGLGLRRPARAGKRGGEAGGRPPRSARLGVRAETHHQAC